MSHTALPRATPESQGIASTAISAFLDAAQQQVHDLHGIMLLRHGKVVAEGWWAPYAAAKPHMLFSLSKSFTSTAIGLAVAEGRLSVDDLVLPFFPDEAPANPDPMTARMRVRHLLSMSTGQETDTLTAIVLGENANWAKAFFSVPVTREPGSFFLYNSGATYMLSALIQKLTGMTLLDYLTPRLLEPLGIHGATSESCPRGIHTGGWGIKIKTDDIARFGQLYLQHGQWQGKQLIPAAWVAEASAKHVSNGSDPVSDWAQGYGYQFWRCQHGGYRGDGAFGQYCVILQEQDTVLAINGGIPDMQIPLNLVWQHLLPAMGAAPLPDNPAAQGALKAQLASLMIPPQSGARSSPVGEPVTGRVYQFADNLLGLTQASFDFSGDEPVCVLQAGGQSFSLLCGQNIWRAGMSALGPPSIRPDLSNALAPVAVSGAWTAGDAYTLKVLWDGTPFINTLACKFAGDTVTIDMSTNVSFGPTTMPPVVGAVAR